VHIIVIYESSSIEVLLLYIYVKFAEFGYSEVNTYDSLVVVRETFLCSKDWLSTDKTYIRNWEHMNSM
jgi:hypothetical protein